ncbi:ethylene-responsive transcription factor ERF020-like [Nicotiana tabacum]|uniref:Ethylene-responsive transcription factor ERF020-like n=2 Tax=Nicotiana TaxID=4085 RepID=A0A1S3XV09_TOBAC|nr:PREDICTED: ethylene-responsive transcription factor ERF020-like [Nicotiana sylvestris]XP_016443781.1 PREDICTED: ethylene-responsive transcription factor ERF020-like [Nicotiana tabacum]
MSSSDEGGSSTSAHQKKYRGIRRRKWGKWVSEIRVPGSSERLWLGTYATPEAAAVAHDIAYYCLRESSSLDKLNFPFMLPVNVDRGMSPRSVQKVASDAGMAIDAKLVTSYPTVKGGQQEMNIGHVCQSVDNHGQSEALSISVEDYLY